MTSNEELGAQQEWCFSRTYSESQETEGEDRPRGGTGSTGGQQDEFEALRVPRAPRGDLLPLHSTDMNVDEKDR